MEQELQELISTTIEEVISNANLLAYDKTALVLSIIALISSFIIPFITVKITYRSEYRKNLYEKNIANLLMIELPSLIKQTINYESKKVSKRNSDKLEKLIGEFRVRILPFKYIDSGYYNALDKSLIKIDECIVMMYSRKDTFDNKYAELNKHMEKIYKRTQKFLTSSRF